MIPQLLPRLLNEFTRYSKKILLIFFVSLTAGSVFSQTTWTGLGNAGQWDDDNNWDAGIPAGQDAIIDGSNVTITSGITGATPTRLIIQNNGTLTLSDGGTLATTDTIRINSGCTLTITAGLITTGARPITGGGTFSIQVNGTFSNLGTVDISTLTVAGTNNPTLNVNGDWGVTNFTAGLSTITMLGSGTRFITSSNTFHRLTINRTAQTDTIRATSAVTVTVDSIFTLTQGVFVTDNTSGITLTGASGGADQDSIRIADNGRLIILGTLGFPAEFEKTGLTSGSLVSFGGGNQNIAFQEDDGGALTYGGLTVTGTGTKTALGALDVNGNFNLSSTTLALSNFTHTFAGDWNAASGTITTTSGSSVSFDGVTQTITESATNSLIDVTFTGSSIKQLGSTLQVTGNITVNGVDLQPIANSILLQGNFTISGGGTFTAGTSRVTFDGSGAQSVPATTFYRLYTAGSGTKTAAGGITVQDSVNIGSGTTLDLSSFTHTFGGELVINGGTTSLSSTGTLQFNNTAAVAINAVPNGTIGTLNNLSIIGTSIVTIGDGDSLVVTGNVTINSGAFLRIDGTGNFSCNNLTVTGTLDIFGTRSFPGIGGTVTYNQLTSTSFTDGRVRYSNNTDQTISNLVSGCYNLTVNNAATAGTFTKTATGNLLVNYQLIVGEGGGGGIITRLVMGSSDLTVVNNITISVNDTLRCDGTVTLNALASEYAELTLTAAGANMIVNNLVCTQLATPSDGREVTIRTTGAGAALTINGNWTVNNTFGSASTLFEMEFATSTGITMAGGSNLLTLGAYCWISTTAATNFRDFILTVENVSFHDSSGVSYYGGGNQTIAALYNGGVTTLPYENVHIDNAIKTPNGNLDINGNFIGNADAQFDDGGFTVNVAGHYGIGSNAGVKTGTVVFDGTNQTIANNAFNNMTFSGSGTKTNGQVSMQVPAGGNDQTVTVAGGAWDINGSVVINSGVTVNAGNDINHTAAGNWTNNTGGTFTHTGTGTVTFDGTTDQVISGQFNRVTLANTTDTVWAGGTLSVAGNFVFNANSMFADSGKTVSVGGNWTRSAAGTVFVPTGTMIFNGSTAQAINLSGGGATIARFNNLEFSGAGTKTLSGTGLDVNGNFTIQAGTGTVALGALANTIAGNYSNLGGTLSSTGTFTFDGGLQTIGGENNFPFIVIAGTNAKKTLSGNLRSIRDVTINSGDTLDVSSNNYSIDIDGNWTNNGVFIPRSGTVKFNASSAAFINSGGNGAGKKFYNLNLSKVGNSITLTNNVDVDNDLTIGVASCTFSTSTNNYLVNVGGSFSNVGTFTQNNSIVTFDASSGSKTINPGSSTFSGPVVFNAAGATYTFTNNATFGAGSGGDSVTVFGGTIILNNKTITINDSLFIRGGTWNVNKKSTLRLASAAVAQVFSSGTIQVVGQSDSIATVTSTAAANRYSFVVDGNIEARYYVFDNMDANGIQINSGATVNASNNFSDGSFTNGTGRYLLYDGESAGGGAANRDTVRNVVFGAGATINVRRVAGTDTLEFFDATGTLAGAAFEDDNPDGSATSGFIHFSRSGARWTAAAGTSDWNTAGNWSGGLGVPLPTENVTIDTVGLGPNYISPEIRSGVTATCLNLNLDHDSLRIIGTGTLNVDGNLTIASNSVFDIQSNNTINIGGSFSNSSTAVFNKGTSHIIFDNQTGSYTIDTGGDSLNSISFRGKNATWTLTSAMNLSGNLLIDSGTVDVNAGNFGIALRGNWKNSGTFTHRAGTVTLGGNNQDVSGTNNTFYNLTFNNAGIKTFSANVDVNQTVTFGGTTVILDAQTNDINVAQDWLVTGATSGIRFRQTGSGTLTFDGTGAAGIPDQVIEGTDTLNHVVFSGNTRVEINGNCLIQGNLTNSLVGAAGTDIIDINSNTIRGVGGSNTLTMHPSTVLRLDASNFPKEFETVTLDELSEVRYGGSAGTDTIETNNGTINYGTLTLQNANSRYIPNGDLTARILTVNDGVNLDLDNPINRNLTVTTTLTIATNAVLPEGHIDADSSTVTFNRNDGAAFAIDADLDTVGNLIILNQGNKNMNDNLVVMGDVTVGADAVLNSNGNLVTLSGSGGANSLSLGTNSRLQLDASFPTGFESITVDPTSTIEYQGTTAQDVVGGFTYGNIEFDNGGGAPDTARAALTIAGNMTITGDAGFVTGAFTHRISGNWTFGSNASVFTSTGSKIIFEGDNQTISNGSAAAVMVFDSVQFSGSGTKFLSADDDIDFNGSVTIDSAIAFDVNNQNTNVGSHWTNRGTFTQTGGTVTFDGTNQTIDPGTSSYNNIAMSGSGTKTFASNGIDVNGTFTINGGVSVDFGNLSHSFANTWTNGGNEINTTGTFTFDGASFVITPGATDTFNIVVMGGSGTKTMGGIGVPWVQNGNLTINNGVTLTNATNNNSVFLAGDFLNSGTYNAGAGIMTFNASSGPRSITTNGSALDEVRINATGVTYSLQSATNTINGPLRIFAGTFDLNGRTLNFGNAATDSIDVGGTLEVDANASLLMDNQTNLIGRSGSIVRVVGTSGNVANLTVQTPATDRYGFFMLSGSTMHARFYALSYMDSIAINNGASIDATNDFSDGSFSNGLPTGVYLILANVYGAIDTINNVTFNAGPANNIRRPTGTGGSLVRLLNYSGALGGATYEIDPDNLIDWGASTFKTWTGASSTVWNLSGNWSPSGVPNNTQDVYIPNTSNKPSLSSGSDGQCRSLTLGVGAILTISGRDLTVGLGGVIDSGTITIAGTDTIRNAGDWNIITGGSFSPGSNGAVVFNGTTGTQTITMPSHSFRNIRIEGTSTAVLGSAISINGSMDLASTGTFDVSTSNFAITARGNWIDNGNFIERTGTVTFSNGTGSLTITNGEFYNLTMLDSSGFNGARTTSGSMTVGNNLLISSGTLTAGGSIDVNGVTDANPIATAAWRILTGATFNDGGFTHTLAGGISNEGTWTGTGILRFDGTGINPINFGNALGNVDIATAGTLTLGDTLTLNNLDISSGILTTTNFYPIVAASGTDTLTMLASTSLNIGASMSGFESFFLDAASTVTYNGNDQTVTQTIAANPPGQPYGNLILTGSSTLKVAGGDLGIAGNLTINAGVTFDMSVNNYNLSLGGDWDNDNGNGGPFIARLSEVTLDGSGTQNIFNFSSDSSRAFYKLTVSKPSNSRVEMQDPATILNNLTINSGTVDLNNNDYYIGGNFTNLDSIEKGGASQMFFVPPPGTFVSVTSSASPLDQVEFNSLSSVFTLQDGFQVHDNLILTNGKLLLNGKTMALGQDGGGTESHSINDTLYVDAGATLQLSSNSTLTASDTSALYIVGTSGNLANVTRLATGSYAFSINGKLHARFYKFEYMNTSGIQINSTAIIDATNDLSDGTFTNGTADGIFLRVENTQSDTINNVAFPTNPGGTSYNVVKVSASTGKLVFKNFSGVFGGESFDNDPTGDTLIVWLTPDTLFWDGSSGTDWFTADNWTPNVGPARVPDSSAVVVINNTVNKPSVDSLVARCNDLIINTGGRLTLNGGDLNTDGSITFTGELKVNNATDTIFAGGSWVRNTGGTFTNGNGVVVLDGTSGTVNINNGTSPFYNLRMTSSTTFLLASALTVTNDLTVTAGTLDVSTSNFAITVGGNYSNAGSFNSRAGSFTMNASSGTKTINAGGTGNAFNNLNFTGAATFQMSGSDLAVNNNMTISAGTFDLNGRSINFGNGAGDVLSVASGATLEVDANAFLRMGASTSFTVNSGGTVRIVGTSESAIATVTRQSTGTYAFAVNGTIHAQYYLFEYMNTSGIQLNSTATINATNNFSNGTFSNGASGGRYLLIDATTVPSAPNDTILNVAFNNGPSINVRRTSGSAVIFKDATGALAGSSFEDDSPDGGDLTGSVRWVFSVEQRTWTGASSTNWNDNTNWNPTSVPTADNDVIIPNVTNDPVIDTTAQCRNLTIQSGAVVTLQGNDTLIVRGSMTNSSGTLTVANGSASHIFVGNAWTNNGTFNHGSASTVILTANTGIKTITDGTSAFYNLRIDSGATFNLSSPLDIDNDIVLNSGTLDATASNYRINIGGDWKNFGATFTARNDSVVFDDTGADTVYTGGTAVGKTFYTVVLSKTGGGSITIGNNDITMSNNLNLNSGTLLNGANAMNIGGNWTNSAATFTAGTGIITLNGSGTNTLTNRGQPFEFLTINKSGGGQITITDSTVVNGILNVAGGTFFLNGKTVRVGNAVGTDTVAVSGLVNIDAGAFLKMHQSARTTINSAGTLTVVGNSVNNVSTITSLSTTAGWQMTVLGNINARFARFSYSGGNGITIASGATINATNNFSNTTFDNGTGTAYLTIQNAQTFSPSGVRFDSAATNRTTYNVVYVTGTGQVSFTDYKGTMAGVNYENDANPAPFGRVRWSFNETQNVNGSAKFGNDLVLTSVGNTGSTNVQMVGDTLNLARFSVARYYTIQPTTAGTGTGTVRLYYGDAELGSQVEANLLLWRRRNNAWVRVDTINGVTFTRDANNNFVQAVNYAFQAGVRDTLVISDATNDASLPVELAFFRGRSNEGKIMLEWRTESETNNAYWLLQRREITADELEKINSGLMKLSDVHSAYVTLNNIRGQGSKTSATEYSQMDTDVKAGKSYAYRLADVSYNGVITYHDDIMIASELPKKFGLRQNYPNPFNPTTTVKFELPVAAKVSIKIYNILGQEVYTLVDKTMDGGFYEAQWNGINKHNAAVASGVYIYRILATSLEGKQRFTQTKKMMIVK